ncbi:MAG: SH3 domain-containing protein [Aggregatilineales bacterium]
MKLTILRLALLGWIVLLMGSLSLVAQDDRLDDKLFYIEGDALIAFDLNTGEVTEVIAGLPRLRGMTLSPTNDFIVYRADPDVFADQIAADCPCGGELPADLVLVNLRNGESTLIAGQPQDSTLSTGITRSLPVWSPDGTHLAWTEGLESSTLVIYDRLTGEQIIGDREIPAQALASSTAQLRSWTQAGILASTVDFGDDFNQSIVGFTLFRSDGTLRLDIPPQFDTPDTFFMAHYGDPEVIAVNQSDDSWVFLDSVTGEPVNIEVGWFGQYAIAAPESSLRLLKPTINEAPPYFTFEIRSADNMPLTEVSGTVPFLAPFGNGVIQQTPNQLTVWRGEGDIITFDLTVDFVIYLNTHTQTIIIPTETPLVTRGICSGSVLNLRLETQSTGVVLGTTPNNVRAEANTSAEVVGQIAAGDWFDVLDGPVCSDGIAWWNVSTPDVMGWTAEGVDDEYFVRPGCPEVGCTRG